MHRSVSIKSAVVLVVALGMIAAVSAQQAAQAGRQGGQAEDRGGGGGGRGAARAAAAATILEMELVQPPSQTGQTKVVQEPDFTKVDEAGFIDLMPGSGHGTGGYIHVSQFQVYGRPVAPVAATASR